jgi:hypothetical protein
MLEDKSVNPVEQAAYNNDVKYHWPLFWDYIIEFIVGSFTFNPGFLCISTTQAMSSLEIRFSLISTNSYRMYVGT